MRPFRLVSLAAVAVLAAACSGSGGSPSWSFDTAPAAAPTAPAASAPPAGEATRLEVTLSDALTMTPSAMTVPVGQPVTFIVTNTGTVLHEFTLGDAAEQDAHEAEMMAAGGMSMPADEPMAIGVMPGTTKELVVTFATSGTMLAGCHVTGHYAAGMRAAIAIQ